MTHQSLVIHSASFFLSFFLQVTFFKKFSSHEIFIGSGQLPSKSEMVWVYVEEG